MSGWIPIGEALPDDLVGVDVWAEPNGAWAAAGHQARRFADCFLAQGRWKRGDQLDHRGFCVELMGYTVSHWRRMPPAPRAKARP